MVSPKVEIRGIENHKRNFRRGRAKAAREFETEGQALGAAALMMKRFLQRNRFSRYGPDSLDTGTGDARASIQAAYVKSRSAGVVGSPRPFYVTVHELGATIRPKTKKVLRFKTRSGDWRSAKIVHLPQRGMYRKETFRRKGEIRRFLQERWYQVVKTFNGEN